MDRRSSAEGLPAAGLTAARPAHCGARDPSITGDYVAGGGPATRRAAQKARATSETPLPQAFRACPSDRLWSALCQSNMQHALVTLGSVHLGYTLHLEEYLFQRQRLS